MVDAVQNCAGTESVHVRISGGAQFTVGGDNRPLASPPDHHLVASQLFSPVASPSQSLRIVSVWAARIKGIVVMSPRLAPNSLRNGVANIHGPRLAAHITRARATFAQ